MRNYTLFQHLNEQIDLLTVGVGRRYKFLRYELQNLQSRHDGHDPYKVVDGVAMYGNPHTLCKMCRKTYQDCECSLQSIMGSPTGTT